jgi:hypothetical protein
MDVLKMVEDSDYVKLKAYIESRTKELLDKRIEMKKQHLKESLETKTH